MSGHNADIGESALLDEMDNCVSSLLLRQNRLAMPPADLHRRGLIVSAIV